MRRVSQLAASTPADRERYLDLLRAVAIATVVLGHWLVTALGYNRAGQVVGHSALVDLPSARPVTWLLQVIPVFFFVGGYANAASLTKQLRHGGDRIDWLRDRSARLIPPTTMLLLVLAGAALLAGIRGADPAEVRTVVWLATIPLWFLAAYLTVVALTPIMYALHRRFGLAVPLVLVILVALGDLARLHGPATLAGGNFLFGWLAIHQIGFFWRDRRLPARPRSAVPLLVGGLAAVLLLTLVGPYPVSMINLPGERLNNSSPPTLALLATAAFQLGLALALRGPAERCLRRPRAWLVVVAMNAVVLTIFLWHMVAVVLLIGTLDAVHRLPTPPVDSLAWVFWRVPWLITLTLILAVLVAVFGRFELRKARRADQPGDRPGWLPAALARVLARPAPRALLTLVSYAAVILGLLGNSQASPTAPEPAGLPTTALLGYLAGAGALRVLRSIPGPRR